MEILNFVVILLLLVAMFVLYRQNLKLRLHENQKADIKNDITQMRNIGELSVFRIYSKEIVTKKDDAIGGFWSTLFGWSMSKKQIAIIFEFEIEFIYDLMSSDFSINSLSDMKYSIKMPPCSYKYSIKDMKIYDGKNAKFLPFLLPDSLNGIFGASFSENDKNKLIDEAKDEIKGLSVKLINDLSTKIHKSATDTLEAIAKSFGAKSVKFEFNDKNIAKIDIKGSQILLDNSLQKQIDG